MTDFSGSRGLPVTIWTGGIYGQLVGTRSSLAIDANFASVAWATANKAIYSPIWLPFSYPVRNLFCMNAATVTGNVDIGVYNKDFALLASAGTTAMAGASTMQFFAKDIVLEPGQYYLAYTMSGTTATVFASVAGTANRHRYSGALHQTSALPLPASATPAAAATDLRIPAVGFTWLSGTPSF